MKVSFKTLRKPLALASMLVLTAGFIQAQTLDLTFDMGLLNNSDYNPNNVYVTFSGNQLSATLGGTAIAITSGTIPSSTNLMTQSFSVAQIESEGANGGFTVSSATSVVAYISYGSDTDFNNAAATPSPVTEPTRFATMEFTYNPTGAAQGDTTYINSFGGGLNMTTYSDLAETEVQETRAINSDVTSAAIFQNLASNAISSGAGYSSVVQTATQAMGPNAGQTIYNRVVMPTTNITNISTGANTAYPSFQPYVNQLITNAGGGSVATLGLIAPGADPTVSPAQAYIKTNTGTFNYDLNYNNFQTVITSSGTGAATAYTITMTGTVTAVMTAGQTPDINNPATITYTGLAVTVQLANAAALNAFIYGQPTPANAVTGVTFSQTGSNWSQLTTDFGPAAQNFYYRIPNDLTEGLLVGAVGSTQPSGIGGLTIGQLNSAQWFANPQLTYSTAQPGSPLYNELARFLWEHSGGSNNGTLFTDGGLYANSYDDRYLSTLIDIYGSGLPETQTAALNVALIPDGNLDLVTVPEPGSYALFGLGVLVLGILGARRQRAKI